MTTFFFPQHVYFGKSNVITINVGKVILILSSTVGIPHKYKYLSKLPKNYLKFKAFSLIFFPNFCITLTFILKGKKTFIT